MRTLSGKLTLAFLLVGITGALLVALFVSQRTSAEFERFLLDRNQQLLHLFVTRFYEDQGSWEGVERVFSRDRVEGAPPRIAPHIRASLIDINGRILFSSRGELIGAQADKEMQERAVPIVADGREVGRLAFVGGGDRTLLDQSEAVFLRRVGEAVTWGALGASLIALLIGIFLARTIARPVRALTMATEIVAQGDLGYQAPVSGHDEIGQLGRSFNRMSADLAHASRQRRQMTADIAHDLRTPLSIILGYTEALADGKLPGDAATYAVMHGEARHLQHLIDDLRTLSLADAGELPLMPQPVDVDELLARVAASQRIQAQEREVRLCVDSVGTPVLSQLDPERMTQVLGNLVGNALRFTPAGGSVTLIAEYDENETRIQVRDTGAGIAAEDVSKVFDRFYQADKSRHNSGDSGLGLPIARSIVNAHGGRIEVSSAPGEGATFTIHLPHSATAG